MTKGEIAATIFTVLACALIGVCIARPALSSIGVWIMRVAAIAVIGVAVWAIVVNICEGRK